MFTDQQKAQIRRHLGYPVVGNPLRSPIGGAPLLTGFQGYRFFKVSGALEYRLNWLSPIEEAMISGLSQSMVTISTSPLSELDAGLTASIQIIGTDVDETIVVVTDSDINSIYFVSLAFANAILSNANLMNAGFNALSPVNTGTYSGAALNGQVPPYPGIQITAKDDFQLVVISDGNLILSSAGNGVFDQPVATFNDATYKGYIQILGALESAIAGSSDNLDTEKADVWTARKDEVQVRGSLYNIWRRKLAMFLEIPLFEDTGLSMVERYSGRNDIMVA